MSCSGQKNVSVSVLATIVVVALSVIVSSLIPIDARSQTVREVFRFDSGKLELGRSGAYDIVRYPSLELTYEIGSPQLPVKLVHIPLPPGKMIARVEVVRVESAGLDGLFTPFPCQKPQPLSEKAISFDHADPVAYSRTHSYPREIAAVCGDGFSSGFGVGAFTIYPVQYSHTEKKLTFYSLIEVEITFGDAPEKPVSFDGGVYAESFHRKTLESLTGGPVATRRFAEGPVRSSPILPDEEHLYVIITDESMVAAFEPFARWKLLKGLSSEIVTVQYITANYTGTDVQDQIRNFIKDAYANWGTVWVLLGGDTNVIPERKAYAMDAEYAASSNEIPCDLYYADLDGDWNANGNGVYGEVDDGVDMYPEVFLGRAPVENASEAANWIGKMNTYEKPPACGHELDILFLAMILWDDPYTDSGEGLNYIDELYVPDRFDPITKLYESLGNENRTTAINALNAGPNIVNHNGHANTTVMGVGHHEYLRITDMDMLNNDERPSVLYSIGCFPAAIDNDCIAEHFVTNAGGGGVAFIGNSRYGWGSPGNPLYGYSDRFDQQFFRMLFDEGIEHIGQTLAAAKSVYVPFAQTTNVYRWCEFEINLLGDPEMPIWTDTPGDMTVSCPSLFPLGPALCPVTVTRTADGTPVEGALVCVLDDAGVYETGLTGVDGCVQFEITTTNPASIVYVTATAKNMIPNVTFAFLQSTDPFVQLSSYSANGSDDGFVAPDDVVSVDACFKNYGSQPAYGVAAVIRTGNPLVTLTDSTVSLGTIPAGDSVCVTGAFAFDTVAGIENGDVILFETEISAAAGLWMGEIGVTGATSVFVCAGYGVLDLTGGDGDGFVDPGETADLNVYVKNTGFDPGGDVTVTFSTTSPHLSFASEMAVCGGVEPDETRCAHTGLVVDPACPVPMIAEIDILIEAAGGLQFNDMVMVAIGGHGLADDVEGGDGDWTHNGTADMWHRSSNRSHSGTTSWYNGVEGLFEYGVSMEDTLVTGPVVIGVDTRLSFWCWYEFATYGSDGVYVEVSDDGSAWTTLDFLGSGGALGALVVGNDWLEYSYDLSGYTAGSNLWLRFRFYSDGDMDVAEGAYIDDVCVGPRPIDIVTGIDPRIAADGMFNRLDPNYPNPFNPETTIRFTLERQVRARLEVFDVNGSRVRLLHDGPGVQGINTVVWDGKNDQGVAVSTGVYFYRIVAGDFVGTRKMMLLK